MPLDSKLRQSLQDLQDLTLGSTEQDVREDFIKPLLELLGYRSGTENAIERNIALKVSYLKIGTKKINVSTFPDYVLSATSVRKWVLDAKNPSESVLSEEHIFQVHSYAMHKEINVPLYGLCNGDELALYRTTDNTNEPVLHIRRAELYERWEELYQLLPVEGFRERLNYQSSQQLPEINDKSSISPTSQRENIINKEPIQEEMKKRAEQQWIYSILPILYSQATGFRVKCLVGV